jgi:hypothetical protein
MLPESFASEFKYNLDFSRRFRWKIVPEVLAREHSDSAARLTFCDAAKERGREWEREWDRLEDWIAVLGQHGAALRAFAPRRYQAVLRAEAISHMLIGDRWHGVWRTVWCLCRYPRSPMNWAALFAALAGRSVTQRARTWRSRRKALPLYAKAGIGAPAHVEAEGIHP